MVFIKWDNNQYPMVQIHTMTKAEEKHRGTLSVNIQCLSTFNIVHQARCVLDNLENDIVRGYLYGNTKNDRMDLDIDYIEVSKLKAVLDILDKYAIERQKDGESKL